ncbi:MAG: CheB methylesterase domain-containing protein [Eubacteriales bacterium]|nr:CheB methylesterase domain-containing protein [Lachnospiraceae bacterium]MDO5128110.1 CheB methylesterase domain-containing protein [Eubacteriales bacterium]
MDTSSSDIVVIICSTGGPKALHSIVPKLPKNLKTPVLIVQHMGDGMTNIFAGRLNMLSEIQVKEATHGERLKQGTVYIAKGGMHLTVDSSGKYPTVCFDDSPAVFGIKPCGDILLRSLIQSPYRQVICAILTGMGNDGTAGLKELSKHKSIYVIAQNEESSTVFGMPKVVLENGLADCVCDLEEIADNIIRKVGVC